MPESDNFFIFLQVLLKAPFAPLNLSCNSSSVLSKEILTASLSLLVFKISKLVLLIKQLLRNYQKRILECGQHLYS